MLNTYRRNDAVLIICQNNAAKQLEIAGLNESAQKTLGYGQEEITGQPLHKICDDRMAEILIDKVEYKADSDDLGEVLSRQRQISLRNKYGVLQEFRMHIVRSEVVEGNPTFHLVLKDERVESESDQFKQVLKENFRGHEVLEESTGLPNRASLMKDLELFQFFSKKRQVAACFAVLNLDNADALSGEMGAQVPFKVLKHLGQLCKQRLRNEDVVGLLSGNALGLILMQITPESSRVVLNRLRWSAASMPVILENGKRVDPQISISFTMVGHDSPSEIIDFCESRIIQGETESGNVYEVG